MAGSGFHLHITASGFSGTPRFVTYVNDRGRYDRVPGLDCTATGNDRSVHYVPNVALYIPDPGTYTVVSIAADDTGQVEISAL